MSDRIRHPLGGRLPAMALRGRHLILIDALAAIASWTAALALRFDAPSDSFTTYLSAFLWFIPVLVAARLVAFVWFRLYQRVWRYASVDELLAVVLAVSASSAVAYAILFTLVLATPVLTLGFPRSVAITDTVVMIALAGAWRFAFRLSGVGRRGADSSGGPLERALVVGDGAAALATIRELRENPSLGLNVVGILADDLPRNQRLMGLAVLGARNDLQDAIRRHQVQVVLLALPAVDGRTLRRLVRVAEAEGVRCLTVPSVAEVVAGRVQMNAIRDVEVEDLLRRAPSRIDLQLVGDSIRDSCVLITGAGGSIGSELARQIIGFKPRKLLLLGRGENSIFEGIHSLPRSTSTDVVPVIMDIRERRQLLRLFSQVRPDVVFHAAAHKHVSFMESYPEQAVLVNVLGTANVLDAALSVRCSRFVLISTDKAVNPTSVMGTTKRIGELLVHEAAAKSALPYTVVRFGNVLSSRGSVVPLFRQQLARGGPLTITDLDATRYFMTIPEAVQLVLQAAIMAEPGDTFVLDMGEPVRISELARDLIQLHGLEPDEDVELQVIGRRPGEKLVEELYLATERPEPTAHDAIRRVRGETRKDLSLREQIERLGTLAEAADRSELIRSLQSIVPEYTPEATNASTLS
jgi:FlaA1/EpsC-like NDP-sugar epimerase